MIIDPQAPIQQRENLERLRKVIGDCTLHESLAPHRAGIRQKIYLTCLKDKVVELQLGLQAEKELIGAIVTKDLAQQTYEQQLKDISADDGKILNDLYYRRFFLEATLCTGVITSLILLLAITH
jgi:hypothetical protein